MYIHIYSTGHKYCNISTGVLVDFHMITVQQGMYVYFQKFLDI